MAGFSEAEWSPAQVKDGLKLISLCAPKKGNKILDYGCGIGNLTMVLSNHVGSEGKVIGIDPNAERLQLAKEKYSASNIEYLQGTHKSIPGRDYDVIFSDHVLHYCPDKGAVIKHFASKLKPGGTLAIIMNCEDELSRLKSVPGLYRQKFINAYGNWFHHMSLSVFKDVIAANNFNITHSEEFLNSKELTTLSRRT